MVGGGFYFAGEFGGYLGLFLGASVISLFEILDLLLYNSIRNMATRKSPELPMIAVG